MQDGRRRGKDGSLVDQAAETAIQQLLGDLPPDQHHAELRRLRVTLGELLSTAPPIGPSTVEDVANRARLAAAFRSKVPDGEG